MNGELWTPGGRLTDYSYAGYMGNDVPIPFNPVTDSVKNYGAVGDGVVDDSRAFLAAIASLKPGSVLFVPAGKTPTAKNNSPRLHAFVFPNVNRLEYVTVYVKTFHFHEPL